MDSLQQDFAVYQPSNNIRMNEYLLKTLEGVKNYYSGRYKVLYSLTRDPFLAKNLSRRWRLVLFSVPLPGNGEGKG